MKLVSGVKPRPRRILLYGQAGVGKSSWAACAPKPVFVNIEDGLADIDCVRTDPLRTFDEVLSAIQTLAVDPAFYTLVVDSIDWLDTLILGAVAHQCGKDSYQEIPFGRGAGLVAGKWGDVLAALDVGRTHAKSIILLAHSRIVRFENPETQAYDRYEPDLHKLSSGVVQEWCDEVLFASFRTFVVSQDAGFGRERSVATGGKERFIRTNESAAAVAKNRLRLPDELPMDWSAYFAFFPRKQDLAPFETTGNIAGVIANGSSKPQVNDALAETERQAAEVFG